MKIIVTIEAQQIYSRGNIQTEENRCEGTIQYLERGTLVEFEEIQEKEKVQFKLLLLPNKVISVRNGQKITFDTQKEDIVEYQTPYGIISMQVNTKKIQMHKRANKIEEIILEYDIQVEEGQTYQNKINFKIEEN